MKWPLQDRLAQSYAYYHYLKKARKTIQKQSRASKNHNAKETTNTTSSSTTTTSAILPPASGNFQYQQPVRSTTTVKRKSIGNSKPKDNDPEQAVVQFHRVLLHLYFHSDGGGWIISGDGKVVDMYNNNTVPESPTSNTSPCFTFRLHGHLSPTGEFYWIETRVKGVGGNNNNSSHHHHHGSQHSRKRDSVKQLVSGTFTADHWDDQLWHVLDGMAIQKRWTQGQRPPDGDLRESLLHFQSGTSSADTSSSNKPGKKNPDINNEIKHNDKEAVESAPNLEPKNDDDKGSSVKESVESKQVEPSLPEESTPVKEMSEKKVAFEITSDHVETENIESAPKLIEKDSGCAVTESDLTSTVIEDVSVGAVDPLAEPTPVEETSPSSGVLPSQAQKEHHKEEEKSPDTLSTLFLEKEATPSTDVLSSQARDEHQKEKEELPGAVSTLFYENKATPSTVQLPSQAQEKHQKEEEEEEPPDAVSSLFRKNEVTPSTDMLPSQAHEEHQKEEEEESPDVVSTFLDKNEATLSTDMLPSQDRADRQQEEQQSRNAVSTAVHSSVPTFKDEKESTPPMALVSRELFKKFDGNQGQTMADLQGPPEKQNPGTDQPLLHEPLGPQETNTLFVVEASIVNTEVLPIPNEKSMARKIAPDRGTEQISEQVSVAEQGMQHKNDFMESTSKVKIELSATVNNKSSEVNMRSKENKVEQGTESHVKTGGTGLSVQQNAEPSRVVRESEKECLHEVRSSKAEDQHGKSKLARGFGEQEKKTMQSQGSRLVALLASREARNACATDASVGTVASGSQAQQKAHLEDSSLLCSTHVEGSSDTYINDTTVGPPQSSHTVKVQHASVSSGVNTNILEEDSLHNEEACSSHVSMGWVNEFMIPSSLVVDDLQGKADSLLPTIREARALIQEALKKAGKDELKNYINNGSNAAPDYDDAIFGEDDFIDEAVFEEALKDVIFSIDESVFQESDEEYGDYCFNDPDFYDDPLFAENDNDEHIVKSHSKRMKSYRTPDRNKIERLNSIDESSKQGDYHQDFYDDDDFEFDFAKEFGGDDFSPNCVSSGMSTPIDSFDQERKRLHNDVQRLSDTFARLVQAARQT